MPLPPINVQGPLALQTPAPIQIARYARNGLVPHAPFETEIGASLNFAGATRTKELFRYYGNVASIPSSVPGIGSPTRERWRFAGHTGPLLRRLRCIMLMARQNVGSTETSGGTLYITNADESVTYGTGSFQWGNSPVVTSDVPSEFQWGEVIIGGIPANTDIFGRFEDNGPGRLISACVWEESTKILDANGYVVPHAVAVQGPIYDERRADMFALADDLWRYGAAHLFNWTANEQASPTTRASSTGANLLDTSVTAISAASPGYTLDTRYCKRRSGSGVPCKLWVYGSMSAGSGLGRVRLFDSTSTEHTVIEEAWDTTASWQSVSFELSAALDKFDVLIDNAGSGTFQVGAVSCAQLDS